MPNKFKELTLIYVEWCLKLKVYNLISDVWYKNSHIFEPLKIDIDGFPFLIATVLYIW